MPPRVPGYFDGVLAARRAGRIGRNVHLGFWAAPPGLDVPVRPGEFEAAQAALTARCLALAGTMARTGAEPGAGGRVLDVACGLGGLLEALNGRLAGAGIFGLNIDARQLLVCREIAPRHGNCLAMLAGDAAALPLADGSIEAMFCIEAMFHFPARAGFFAEAARVLRPGGVLVVTDINLAPAAGVPPWKQAVVEQALRRDYGPWPEIWCGIGAMVAAAARAGLAAELVEDWSAATLPSYRTTAPGVGAVPAAAPGAGEVMRWLHRAGWLRYAAARFRRG